MTHRLALIFRRELIELLRAPSVWTMLGVVVLLDGLLFNALSLGPDPKPSARVLEELFELLSATSMAFGILLSMRLVVEERDRGSLVLLLSSPARDVDIVLGKFCAALVVLVLLLVFSTHLPLLVFVHGHISMGHLAAGTLGLFLLGALALSFGLLGSVLSRSQLAAGLFGAAVLVLFLIGWLLARVSDPPLAAVWMFLAVWESHFRPLARGFLGLSHVCLLVSLIALSLAASVRALGLGRWS